MCTCLSSCQKGTAPNAPATIARLLKIGALQTPPNGVLLGKVTNPGGGFGFAASVASIELIYAVPGTVATVGDYYHEHFRGDPIYVENNLSGCNLPTCEQLLGCRPAPAPVTMDSYEVTISAGAPNFTAAGIAPITLPPPPAGHPTYVVIDANGGSAG
jgi:hypothetical protein